MCSIAGVYSREGKSVSREALTLLSALRHRGPEAFGVASSEGAFTSKNFSSLIIPESPFILGHCLLSTTGYLEQPVTVGNVSVAHNGQVYNYRELFPENKFASDAEAIALFLVRALRKKSVLFAVKEFMRKAIGEYAIAFLYRGKLYAFRDPIGVKPLWFGSNESVHAFASEPSALMKIDIQFPQPLLPGHLLKVSRKGLKPSKIFDLNDFRKTVPKKHSMDALAKEFACTIKLQTSGLNKAAVLFSGGVDSSLVAKAVSDEIEGVELFVAGTPESNDISFAEKVAPELGLQLHKIYLDEKKIESLAFRAMKALSFFDEMQLGIGIPELACSDAIAENGFKAVFSGQGSDEIFAGYANYAKVLSEKGFPAVEGEIWFSLSRLWSRNFFRDDAMVSANSLELRVPFVSTNFLREAMAFPAKEKILTPDDKLRKHPVRALAAKYGLPEFVALRPKKAMQYGSGVQKIVSRLFQKT